MVNNMDILKYKQALQNISNIKLDKQSIINCICSFGLNHDTRPIYGSYVKYMNSANDLGLWQKPEELSECILYLLNNLNINSFLEIGTYKASTFLILREFLLSKNCNLISKTIDPKCYCNKKILDEFNINYEQADISKIKESYDLVFIDGNHSYAHIKQDFEYCIQYSTKYILIHDIVDRHCPGVVKFWNEIKDQYHTIEFTDGTDIMGIGLIIIE